MSENLSYRMILDGNVTVEITAAEYGRLMQGLHNRMAIRVSDDKIVFPSKIVLIEPIVQSAAAGAKDKPEKAKATKGEAEDEEELEKPKKKKKAPAGPRVTMSREPGHGVSGKVVRRDPGEDGEDDFGDEDDDQENLGAIIPESMSYQQLRSFLFDHKEDAGIDHKKIFKMKKAELIEVAKDYLLKKQDDLFSKQVDENIGGPEEDLEAV